LQGAARATIEAAAALSIDFRVGKQIPPPSKSS
jgi:hypothetical protein